MQVNLGEPAPETYNCYSALSLTVTASVTLIAQFAIIINSNV